MKSNEEPLNTKKGVAYLLQSMQLNQTISTKSDFLNFQFTSMISNSYDQRQVPHQKSIKQRQEFREDLCSMVMLSISAAFTEFLT